jgi:alkyl sulfatase BDS1-like metallo-beta-lactamase superfamily hydrolase
MLEIYPDKFKKHKILRGIYGCYRFAIHATYRLYHGWYDSGNPTDLFPSRTDDIAREILNLNSGNVYLEHANKLYSEGKLQLALHILDIIIKGSNEKDAKVLADALKLKLKILREKAKVESSFIATNILEKGAREIKTKLKELGKIKEKE